METPLKQCSLEPQGFIFPDRRDGEIRKFKTRYMPASDYGTALFHTPGLLVENILCHILYVKKAVIRAFYSP